MRDLQRGRLRRWAMLFGLWTLIVLFYSSTSMGSGQRNWTMALKAAMAQWYVWALLSPLIVGVDRKFLAGRETLMRRLVLHIPVSLLFTAAYTYLSGAATLLLRGEMPLYAMPFEMLRNGIYWNVSVYWVIIGVYLAFDYQDHLKDRRLRTAELERLLSESRLQTLRAQLHPHFLFNTLNAISAHVERDPRIARRMIEQLGELLRLSLDHAEDPEIPLEREIAFLERYFDLQKVRFEDRLEVVMNVDPGVLDALVPAFMLQPLVENSVVHGIASSLRPGVISLDAWREGARLRLRVRDDGPGLPAGWSIERHTGLGISNTRERLRRLYGDHDQSFDISGPAGAGVRVDIAIPFRPSSNGTDGSGSLSNESAASTHRR